MSRFVLDADNRKKLFHELKKFHKTSTVKELSEKLGFGVRAIRKWRSGYRTIPSEIVPSEILSKIKIKEIRDDKWRFREAGLKGMRAMLETYPEETVNEWRSRGGKEAWKNTQKGLRRIQEKDPERFYFLVREKKLKKRLKQIKKKNFRKSKVEFNLGEINFSGYDKKRKIKLPKELTPDLAEEIGMHIGDGTLPEKKYYYSLRGDIKEKEYYESYVLPLYKKLYNLDSPLVERPPICGIEISSKAVYEFKNKIIGLPIGVKTNRLEIPKCIIKSQDLEILTAFLQGIFDTDGCFYMSKTKLEPRIQLTIKSKKLIRELGKILTQLGFVPATNIKNCSISLNGTVMFKKWLEEVGTNNQKHTARINEIKSGLPWSSLEKLLNDLS